ncbi:MAG: hypothetical protein VW736_08980, partial [Alphaproteobacteria bacterium]
IHGADEFLLNAGNAFRKILDFVILDHACSPSGIFKPCLFANTTTLLRFCLLKDVCQRKGSKHMINRAIVEA